MKVAIARGKALNKWEMQNFEECGQEFEITACGAASVNYASDAIRLPVKRFRSSSDTFEKWGLLARVGERLHVWRKPDDYLEGLEEWLAPFDIMHGAELHISYSLQVVKAARKHGAKSVITCWETIPYAYEDGPPAIRERRSIVRTGAELFVATTQRAARALRLEGVDENRIRVVMPGVDTSRFEPAPKAKDLLASLGLDETHLVVLTIARLIREKGIRELILAFKFALKQLQPSLAGRCRLLIAGQGPQRAYIESLIMQLDLGQSIRIIDSCDYMQIHRLHQVADVFVLSSIATPYWEEQYGMVLAEAMACGKPVIATNTGGVPEVVDEAGILVPSLEPEAMATEMAELLQSKEKREIMSAAARSRAVEGLSSTGFAAQISQIYRELVPNELPAIA